MKIKLCMHAPKGSLDGILNRGQVCQFSIQFDRFRIIRIHYLLIDVVLINYYNIVELTAVMCQSWTEKTQRTYFKYIMECYCP